MKRLFAPLLLTTLCLSQSSCIFSGPNRCTERSSSSFSTFKEDQWTAYCQDYKRHVESPTEYSLPELTKFLAAHPAKVKELDDALYRFEKYETCFESPKEELELRELQSCLENNDRTDLEIINAWTVAADPWLSELGFKAGALKPALDQAEQEGNRLFKKTTDAFSYHTRVDDAAFLAFSEQVDQIEKDIETLSEMAARYDGLREQAAGHSALQASITSEAGPRVNEAKADAQQMRERLDVLKLGNRFLEYATYAVGVPCPKGENARQEERIAKGIVGGRNNEVRGSGLRIGSKIASDESGDAQVERFTGYICGERARENQFEGAPKLCGQYNFVLERQKEGDDEDWSDWGVKTFEESGPSGGVDCAMLSGALPTKKKRRAPVDDGY